MILLKKYILYSWLFIALVAFIVNNKNNYYNNKGLFYVAVLLRIAIVQLSNIYWTYHSLTYSLIEFIYDWFVQRMSMLRTHIVPYSAQLPIRFISTRLLEDWLSYQKFHILSKSANVCLDPLSHIQLSDVQST